MESEGVDFIIEEAMKEDERKECFWADKVTGHWSFSDGECGDGINFSLTIVPYSCKIIT